MVKVVTKTLMDYEDVETNKTILEKSISLPDRKWKQSKVLEVEEISETCSSGIEYSEPESNEESDEEMTAKRGKGKLNSKVRRDADHHSVNRQLN